MALWWWKRIHYSPRMLIRWQATKRPAQYTMRRAFRLTRLRLASWYSSQFGAPESQTRQHFACNNEQIPEKYPPLYQPPKLKIRSRRWPNFYYPSTKSTSPRKILEFFQATPLNKKTKFLISEKPPVSAISFTSRCLLTIGQAPLLKRLSCCRSQRHYK